MVQGSEKMGNKIIKLERSIIPACDVATLEALKQLVSETSDVEGIGAYKIGFSLVIPFGLNAVLGAIREFSDLPVIYDHQKGGTDIPGTGTLFAQSCKRCEAVILFPQSGPEVEKAWIEACREEELGVIIGGEMTHKAFLQSDGGFIADDAPEKIYKTAASLGVKDFVVPGNKPDRIKTYRKLLGDKAVFYSPGFIAQGGSLSDSARAAGPNWHAIVGRAIYTAKDIHKQAKELTKFVLK